MDTDEDDGTIIMSPDEAKRLVELLQAHPAYNPLTEAIADVLEESEVIDRVIFIRVTP